MKEVKFNGLESSYHLAATNAFAEMVHLKYFGTSIVHCYRFQPQYHPDIWEKRTPSAAKWWDGELIAGDSSKKVKVWCRKIKIYDK